MYGLVNLAIEELVTQVAGKPVWETIKQEVGFNDPGFVILDPYPDELTFALVGSASKHLNMEPADVLHAFGKHWILFTAEKGYGELMTSTADNLIDFLDNLDAMHARVEMSIEGLDLPSFDLEPLTDSTWTLRYFSSRQGLAPMVSGLVEGLAEMFDEKWDITHNIEESANADHEVFEISKAA